MNLAVSVRPLHVDDLPSVALLCQDALDHDAFANRLPYLLSEHCHVRLVATRPVTGPAKLSETDIPQTEVVGVCFASLDRYLSHVHRDAAETTSAPTEGFIDLIAVAPQWQGTGVGRRLLENAESTLAAKGCSLFKIIGNPPHYAWAGVDLRYLRALCLFEGTGYERVHTALNLSVDLTAISKTIDAEAELAKSGLAFRHAEPSDVNWLRSELSAAWKPRWVDQVVSAITDDSQQHEKGVHLAVREDNPRLAGFCAWGVNRPNEIGPLGVDPQFRRLGVGAVLLKRCCSDQTSIGLTSAELQWAGPLEYFSRTLRATTSRAFFTYRKTSTRQESDA